MFLLYTKFGGNMIDESQINCQKPDFYI